MASRLSIGASACTVALVAATFTGASALAEPGQAQPAAPVQQQAVAAVPSAAEVNAAKLDTATTAQMSARLTEALGKTSKQLEKIAEDAQTSWDSLTEAQQRAVTRNERAKDAAKQATAAQQRVDRAKEQVSRIAAAAYRNGGYDPSVGDLLAGDPQDALDRARTLRTLADSRTRDLRSSEADAALAKQWQDYATATQKAADDAVSAQTAAAAKAQEQATGFRTAVQTQTKNRTDLLNRLATLNGTTVADETKAQEKREEAERQAALKAAQEAEAARQAEAAQEARAAEAAAQAQQDTEDNGDVVGGVSRPAAVPGTTDSSDDAQEEGASSDSTPQTPAQGNGDQQNAETSTDDADAQKAAAEKAAADKAAADKAAADEAAAADAAATKKAAEEAAAKQAAADKDAADAKAKADAAQKAEDAAQNQADAEKAKAEREEAQRAAEAKKKAAAEAAKAQDAAEAKAAAAKKKAAAEKAAAAEAAANKKAAEKKAAEKAAAKKAAEKKAAAEAAKKAEQEADDNDNGPVGSSSKESAIAWALSIASNNSYGYIYGANGPRMFDCSSFALTAFAKSGVNMTRTSTSQFQNAPKRIPLSQLQRGDLVFSSSNGGASMYHVAIYIGNGQVVHARNPSVGISTTPLSWVNNLYPLAARY